MSYSQLHHKQNLEMKIILSSFIDNSRKILRTILLRLDMSEKTDGGDGFRGALGHQTGVTEDLLRLLPRDLVFSMRSLGESQYRLQSHFHEFIREELAATGVTQETHPLIHSFIEQHAILRDFVFSGVSLAHQFRVEDIERLLGDTTSIMRVDIWDQLKSHIEMAEKQFAAQISGLQGLLTALEDPSRKTSGEPQ